MNEDQEFLERQKIKFRTEYICLKCGYIRERTERKCPKCGGSMCQRIIRVYR